MKLLDDLSQDDRSAFHEALELLVAQRSGNPCRGEIRSLAEDHALVSFPADQAPDLGIGQQVDLRFRSTRGERALDVPGFATQRQENTVSRVFKFHLLAKHEQFSEFVVRTIGTLRRSERVAVDAAQPITATLSSLARNVSVASRLEDVSVTGLGVRVTLESDAQLARFTRIRTSLPLFAGEPPLELVCLIRHRRLTGSEVHYGLQIEQGTTAAFQHKQRVLRRYVDARLTTDGVE